MSKLEFFGDMNSAVNQLNSAASKLQKLYDDGDIRLRVDEIELIDSKLQEADGEWEKITKIRNKFARIANHKGVALVPETKQ